MGGPARAAVSYDVPGVKRRVLVALCVGAVTFLVTTLVKAEPPWRVMMTIFITGTILTVEFLIDFERRAREVDAAQERRTAEIERRITKISEATEFFGEVQASMLWRDAVIQLVKNSLALHPESLVYRFTQNEVDRMSNLLRDLTSGSASYEGEDRDWILALAEHSKISIDATSLSSVDAGMDSKGFWFTDLGQHYLRIQRRVVGNGVKIRRIFIVDKQADTEDETLRGLCRVQSEMRIEVRILVASKIPAPGDLLDFIIFDNVVVYESTPSPSWRVDRSAVPTMVSTVLKLRPDVVQERRALFQTLWNAAEPYQLELRAEPNSSRPGSA
jgi:hypothetical protein